MLSLFFHASSKHSFIIFRPFSAAHQIMPEVRTFKLSQRHRYGGRKNLNRALKILDLIMPKTVKNEEDMCHHRLIQGCMQDVLESVQENGSKLAKKNIYGSLTNPIHVDPENNHLINTSAPWKAEVAKEDPFLLFLELQRRGFIADAATFSSILSFCATNGALRIGVQVHAVLVKIGYDQSFSFGASLISLYSRCGQLGDAYQVFQMMPTKNNILWTAIIAGHAQNFQAETCIRLFSLMRHSVLKPNDFTFASLLSTCTSSAYLGLGRSVHCLEMKMGFSAYVHVSNALISMYAKCGNITEAHYIFEKIKCRDIISWNSMIFGYAQYGLAEEAIELLKEMDKQNVIPDSISFLGVLSSCRHAGLVEQGRRCFDLMLERGIRPELDHYSCIVDLLGRAGLLDEALDFIKEMPIPANAVIWGSLLSSCRVHGNICIGIHAAESRLVLDPGCAATFVQLANLYASVGNWKVVAEVRKLMKERGLKTIPGYSWIEIGNIVYRFKAEDRSNTQVYESLVVLDCLASHMENLCHTPAVILDLNNEFCCECTALYSDDVTHMLS